MGGRRPRGAVAPGPGLCEGRSMAVIPIEISGAQVLLLPFWIAAIGLMSGRVLGIRIGWWRSVVAASIGWLVGVAAASGTLNADTDSAAIVIPVVAFFGVLATLPIAI